MKIFNGEPRVRRGYKGRNLSYTDKIDLRYFNIFLMPIEPFKIIKNEMRLEVRKINAKIGFVGGITKMGKSVFVNFSIETSFGNNMVLLFNL